MVSAPGAFNAIFFYRFVGLFFSFFFFPFNSSFRPLDISLLRLKSGPLDPESPNAVI